MVHKLYAFSGLGADRRAFSSLDLTGFDVVFVDWLEPRNAESMLSYVLRLSEYYKIPKEGANVIGVSFGGMCISELSNYYDFEKIVLISSAKTKRELPSSFMLSKLLPVHKWVSDAQLTKSNPLLNWLFDVKTEDDKQLLADVVKDSDPKFVRWAVEKILEWDNTHVPKNCLHIHGSKDRVIPIHNVDYTIKIKGGSHFMIVNRAQEISFMIRNFLL